MAGYDDPRFLQQKIEALERDLRDLRARSLPFLVHQRGAIPGAMRAISINDPGLASTMWLALAGGQPGLGPYQAVSDPNGIVRAELGNLAANGVSPAQWGFRASDANGNPIFDSLGLINVMTQLGQAILGSSFATTSATLVQITGMTVTFSLTRALRVLVLAQTNCSYGGGSPNTGFIDLFLDGTDLSSGGGAPAPEILVPSTSSGAATGMLYYSASLAAGSHTFALKASQSGSGSTLTVLGGYLTVWSLGS